MRDYQLVLAGWRMLHYTWRRFTEEPAEVVEEVREALAA